MHKVDIGSIIRPCANYEKLIKYSEIEYTVSKVNAITAVLLLQIIILVFILKVSKYNSTNVLFSQMKIIISLTMLEIKIAILFYKTPKF